MNYGITSAARAMAEKGRTATEIRAALEARHKSNSIIQAIAKLRKEGSLPPRVKKKPTRLVINLEPQVARRLDDFASMEAYLPSQFAKQLLTSAVLRLREPQ